MLDLSGLPLGKPLSDIERIQLEGLKSLNYGYTSWNERLRRDLNEATRVIAFLLKITGPVTIPDIVTWDGSGIDHSLRIVAERNRLNHGTMYSLVEGEAECTQPS